MRILVHDYCGHAFQIELSRWLAAQGHAVLHLSSREIESPRGALAARDDDPPGLAIAEIALGRAVPKYRAVGRLRHDWAYAGALAARLRAFAPDVVLSGNCTAPVQARLLAAARQAGAGFVAWVQDIYSDGVDRALAARFGTAGRAAGWLHRRLEFATLARSDAVVAITEDFRPILRRGGVPGRRIRAVANWAPLGQMTPAAGSEEDWRRARGLGRRFVFLYAGTLGLKHDPELLAALARAFRDHDDIAVVVVSQGLGRDYLEEVRADEGLDNLVLLDFQPPEQAAAMHAAADVLLAVLEPYAGTLSVPSKVLSYLCAGRPVLAAMPAENLAARTIREAEAGIVVPPQDPAALVVAAARLRYETAWRNRLGAAGRAYAERTFDIDAKGRAFLDVLEPVARKRRRQPNSR